MRAQWFFRVCTALLAALLIMLPMAKVGKSGGALLWRKKRVQ
jgi:hypothetical protein